MAKLLIIADDFTGALDSGVQFSAKGASTIVVTNPDYDFKSVDKSVEVLVFVAETRHMNPDDAYKTVYRTVQKALESGISNIYKKTDSALRGNVASELTAVMDAAKIKSIPFLPAFPKLNRTTIDGIHYIEGVPVAESVFGKDPFDPIKYSAISDIFAEQTDIPVIIHRQNEKTMISDPGIQVFDAQTDADLEKIGRELGLSQLQFSGGCAGFAPVLADILELDGHIPEIPKLDETLFVCCGSLNPVTIAQVDEAKLQGFPHFSLGISQKLDSNWADSEDGKNTVQKWISQANEKKSFILDVNNPDGYDDIDVYAKDHHLSQDELRIRISGNFASLMKRVLDEGLQATFLCTGGDTLLAFMQTVGVSELVPICEMEVGIVLTEFEYTEKKYHIITKSGGFGEKDLFVKLSQKLKKI